jgi:hypothetical protein
MIYSDAHKFVYLPIPRTGTTSLVSILVKEYGGIVYPDKDIRPFLDENRGWHENLYSLPVRCESYFHFTSVRNPLDRANSLRLFLLDHETNPTPPELDYSKCNTEEEKLELFMDRILLGTNHWFFKSQYDWISETEPPMQMILKIEHLERDFNSLPFVNRNKPHCVKRDSPKHKVHCLNKSVVENHIKPNSKLIDMVKRWAHLDYVKFGYEEPVMPI